MSDNATIQAIEQARDAAVAALNAAYNKVSLELARTTTSGPYQDSLNAQFDALEKQRDDIVTSATDAVLRLPVVIAAAGQLGTLATEMTNEAKRLPAATDVLKTTGSILALGKQFASLLKAG